MTMDLETAIDETERFLAAWNDGCMQLLGGVIVQAGLDRDAPTLTTTHLHTLLNALHAQTTELAELRAQRGTPRTHYGVRYPDHPYVATAPNRATAQAWVAQYATLVPPGSPPARVQQRTVTRTATLWRDIDEEGDDRG